MDAESGKDDDSWINPTRSPGAAGGISVKVRIRLVDRSGALGHAPIEMTGGLKY
jgi:hypothetical protein